METTNLPELFGLSQLPLSSYEFGGKAFTTQELWIKIAEKMNILIEHFNYLDKDVSAKDKATQIKLDYLLGEGLTNEVAKNILAKIEDGTMESLINNTVLNNINTKVDNNKELLEQQILDSTYENETHVNCRKFGAKLDGVTDDTKAIQDLIDYCETTSKIGVINGTKTIVSGLKVGSFLNLDCGSTIIKLKDYSNMPILMNKNIIFSPNDIVDNNINIVGGIWDCNGERQADNDKDGVVMCGVRFTGVRYLTFEPIELYDTRRYAIYFINVDNFKSDVFNINHKLDDYAYNKDGFHIGGKCKNFSVNTLHVINNGDDGLAINATDVDHGGQYLKSNIDGDIENIYINNVYINGRQGIRMLSGSKRIDGVYISSMKGIISDNVLLCEDYGLLYTGSMKNIHIGTLDVEYINKRHTYDGKFIRICNIGLNSNIHLGNIKRIQSGTTNNKVVTVELEGIIGNILIDNISEINSQATYVIDVINGGDGINNLMVNNIFATSSKTDRAVISVGGNTSFGTVDISNVDVSSMNNFANISSKNLNALIVSNSIFPNSDYFITLSSCVIGKVLINGVIKNTTDWIYNDSQSTITTTFINGTIS